MPDWLQAVIRKASPKNPTNSEVALFLFDRIIQSPEDRAIIFQVCGNCSIDLWLMPYISVFFDNDELKTAQG
jgi:hypothetical protein